MNLMGSSSPFAASMIACHRLRVSLTLEIQFETGPRCGWIPVATDGSSSRPLVETHRSIPSYFLPRVDALAHWLIVHSLTALADSGVVRIPPHVAA